MESYLIMNFALTLIKNSSYKIIQNLAFDQKICINGNKSDGTIPGREIYMTQERRVIKISQMPTNVRFFYLNS